METCQNYSLWIPVYEWDVSSLLFSTSDRPIGIQWTLFSQLENLDFANDTIRCHLQEKTDGFSRFAKQVALNINTSKTQVTVEGEPFDFIEEFT